MSLIDELDRLTTHGPLPDTSPRSWLLLAPRLLLLAIAWCLITVAMLAAIFLPAIAALILLWPVWPFLAVLVAVGTAVAISWFLVERLGIWWD